MAIQPDSRNVSGRRLGLKLVLTGLVLASVTLTALLIHLTWSYTAQRNVADVAEQLNQQIVGSIHQELRSVLDSTVAAQEAVSFDFRRRHDRRTTRQSGTSYFWCCCALNRDYPGLLRLAGRQLCRRPARGRQGAQHCQSALESPNEDCRTLHRQLCTKCLECCGPRQVDGQRCASTGDSPSLSNREATGISVRRPVH